MAQHYGPESVGSLAVVIPLRSKVVVRSKWHPLRLFGVLVMGYLGMLLILLLLEDRLLYHPNHHRGEDGRQPAADLLVQTVWLQAADGTQIHAWWCPRPGSQGAVLYCHGNAGAVSHQGRIIPIIREILGESVLVFDYPGFGRSGGKPSEAGCYVAGDAAYDWLTQRVPPERVVLLGQSLGGGVATDLASRRRHRALVLFKTFTSIPDLAQRQFFFLPARWLVHNQFNNLAKIRYCAGPCFIGHGDRDHLIPLAQAQQLFRAAPAPKQFFLLRGCGHHGTLTREFLAAAADFLRDYGELPAATTSSLGKP